jgi:regulatory protein
MRSNPEGSAEGNRRGNGGQPARPGSRRGRGEPKSPGERSPRRPLVPDDLQIGAQVTSLAPTQRDPRRIAVAVGGRYAGALPVDVVQSLGLKVGMVWTPEADEDFRFSVERDKARRYAIAALSQRGVSRQRLSQALARRGHSLAIIAWLQDDLDRLGLLDDRALAESIARSVLARTPAGPRLIEQRLIARGIARPLAREVALEACGQRDPLDDAVALAAKKVRGAPRSADRPTIQRRVYAALARRGFDPEVCRVATQRAMASDPRRSGGGGDGDSGLDTEMEMA